MRSSAKVNGEIVLILPVPPKTVATVPTTPRTPTSPFFLPSTDYICNKNHVLGEGVFGKVYSGQYNGKQVAIKLSRASLEKNISRARSIKSLKAERRILEMIADKSRVAPIYSGAENLIQYYGYHYNTSKNPYMALVMEYANAGTLGDWIYQSRSKNRKTHIPFTWEAAYPVINDTLMGLYFLHEIKIIHCDLKADNVLLIEQDGKLRGKLNDFGLAQSEEKVIKSKGSPIYLAPEVLMQLTCNTRQSDIYSWACMLFEMAKKDEIYSQWKFTQYDQLEVHVCNQGKRDNIPEDTPKKIAHLVTWGWGNNRPTDLQCIEQLKTDIDVISPELEKYPPLRY